MTKCIFRSVFLAAFAVFIACPVLVMGALYSYFSARQESQLAIEAKLAAAGVESGGEAYLENFGRQDGLRLTWIDSDGTVLYDTNADASSMENHADREEVAQALQTGSGEGQFSAAPLSDTEPRLVPTMSMDIGIVAPLMEPKQSATNSGISTPLKKMSTATNDATSGGASALRSVRPFMPPRTAP